MDPLELYIFEETIYEQELKRDPIYTAQIDEPNQVVTDSMEFAVKSQLLWKTAQDAEKYKVENKRVVIPPQQPP